MSIILKLTIFYIKDILNRRLPWFFLILFFALLILGPNLWIIIRFWSLSTFQSFDLDTKQPIIDSSWLTSLLPFAGITVAIVSVAMCTTTAAISRRSGTSQFILTIPVSRLKLALGQFLAISLFVSSFTVALHLSVVILSKILGISELNQMSISWLYLLVPSLFLAGLTFAFSLIESFILISALSLFLLMLPTLISNVPWLNSPYVLEIIVGMRDNLKLLIPSITGLITWPTLPVSQSLAAWHTISPTIIWLQQICVYLFWILLCIWMYLRRQIGSRLPQK